MKTIVVSTALLALLLASCGSTGTDLSKIEVGPDNTVSWDDAKTIIRDGDVDSVFQSHSRLVRISLADGTRYQTTEPEIDDVIDWVRECGKADSIGIMTE